MAHIKKFFDQGSGAANRTDVLNWLQENAADYFDSFAEEGLLIVCKIGETAVLKFAAYNPAVGSGYNGSTSIYMATLGGASVNEMRGAYDSNSSDFTEYAIKSDSGIMLHMSNYHAIFITKSNAGTTSVYAKWIEGGTASTPTLKWHGADLVNGTAIDSTDIGQRVVTAEMTSLGPVCLPGGLFTPGLFAAFYTQHKGTPGLIYVDGTVYAYDGYLALKC